MAIDTFKDYGIEFDNLWKTSYDLWMFDSPLSEDERQRLLGKRDAWIESFPAGAYRYQDLTIGFPAGESIGVFSSIGKFLGLVSPEGIAEANPFRGSDRPRQFAITGENCDYEPCSWVDAEGKSVWFAVGDTLPLERIAKMRDTPWSLPPFPSRLIPDGVSIRTVCQWLFEGVRLRQDNLYARLISQYGTAERLYQEICSEASNWEHETLAVWSDGAAVVRVRIGGTEVWSSSKYDANGIGISH